MTFKLLFLPDVPTEEDHPEPMSMVWPGLGISSLRPTNRWRIPRTAACRDVLKPSQLTTSSSLCRQSTALVLSGLPSNNAGL